MYKRLGMLAAMAGMLIVCTAKEPMPANGGTDLDMLLKTLKLPSGLEQTCRTLPEMKQCAEQWRQTRLRYDNGQISLPDVIDRELAALDLLLRRPGIAASPDAAVLRRAYLDRLEQQLSFRRGEFEVGIASQEKLRQKEIEVAEFRRRWNLPKTDEKAPPTDGKVRQGTPGK